MFIDSFALFSNMQKVLWDDIVRNQVSILKIIAYPSGEIKKTWASKKR